MQPRVSIGCRDDNVRSAISFFRKLYPAGRSGHAAVKLFGSSFVEEAGAVPFLWSS